MKTKILSLALAIMMILSVAAVLPVNAVTSDEITTDDIILDSANLQTTDETADNYTNAGAIYGWAATDYVEWDTDKAAEMNGNVKYANFNFDATDGVYDIYASIGTLGTGTAVNAEFTVNGYEQRIVSCATAGVQFKPAETYIGQYVLSAEDNLITVGATSNGVVYLWNLLLVKVDDTDFVQDAASSHVKSAENLVFTNSAQLKMEPTGLEWATKGCVQMYATGAVTFNNIFATKSGYYDIYAAVGQPNASAYAKLMVNDVEYSATITQTASSTEVASNYLGRFYLSGDAANVVKYTANTSDTYLYDIKFVYSSNQNKVVEPIDLEPSDGTITSGSYVFVSATETPASADASWIDTGRVFIYGNSATHGVDLSYTVKEAGYYDVLAGIGYALEGAQVYARFDGAGTVQAKVTATSAGGDAKTNNLGRIYLPEGESTVSVRFALIGGVSSTYLFFWDLRLQYSEDQTEAKSIIINAGHAKETSNTGEQNRFDWTVGTNTAGWATASVSKLSSPATYTIYDMYVLKEGYYDAYAAAGTITASALLSIFVDDDEVIDAKKLTAGTSLSNAQETNLGKIYLPAGSVALKAVSDTNSGAYYLYNLKFVYSDDQTAPPEPPTVADATGSATLTANRIFPRSADTHEIDWVDGTGIGYYENGWGAVSTPVAVDKSGYYDVTIAYSSKYAGGKFLVYVDGQSEDIQVAVPCTDETNAAQVSAELALGRMYIPEGESKINVYGYAPAEPDIEDGTPLHYYGLKFDYCEAQTTSEIIINGGIPVEQTEGVSETSVTTEHAGGVEWANNGQARLNGGTSEVTYKAYVPETGYYTVKTAHGTAIAGVAHIALYVDGNLINAEQALSTPPEHNNWYKTGETTVANVYLKEGYTTLRVTGLNERQGCRLYNIKLELAATQPTANKVRLTTNGGLDLASEFYAGKKAYAEVMTTDDVKVFVVNYVTLENGVMKMSTCQEGEVITTDGNVKIIRTTAPVTTTAGTVKAFLWDGTTYAPIDMTQATVVPVPEEPTE